MISSGIDVDVRSVIADRVITAARKDVEGEVIENALDVGKPMASPIRNTKGCEATVLGLVWKR